MPFGSSTSSKRARLEPEEPTVIVRGSGCRVWDDQDRELIDFRNALGPITLGYRHPVVDAAIRDQLEQGIVFGHPHPIECEVAELFCDLVPGMEQARFLKTGGEAIAAAIRIARAHTGRDRIVQIGYNGWLNSLGGGAAVLPGRAGGEVPGVPRALSELHHPVGWNDLGAVERVLTEHPGEVAAVVIAADYARMAEGRVFYPALRRLVDDHGTLLIFDEIVTGFRIAVGGVTEYFGVTPDLAVFGKGIANGMPISVYAGRREVMAACGPGGAVVSTTFGGETLSLAAARATMELYRTGDVVGHLWRQGERLWPAVTALLAEHGLPITVEGLAPCPTFVPAPDAPAGLLDHFFRAAYRHGVSFYNVSYVNLGHADADLDETLVRLRRAVAEIGARS
ncbi:MAG TPA: aminotransferase class III-fold pyridoxal phosphate-dependent enzyme [Microlunatus sp.]|nr:aminotransferase class III-fold pyridoxal phosphate-dependent enzyme [Microlunatus sp.]